MINSITGAASSSSTTPSIADSVEGGEDLFLQLLVSQIRYQNPLDPMDNNEFLAQTAQFTMVEQITRVAEQQTELLAFQRATLAAGMIGQTVTGIDEVGGEEISGIVDLVVYNFGEPQLVIGGVRIGLDEITSTGTSGADTADLPEGTEQEVAL